MKVEIDEGQRQMMLLALAKLSLERPGWDMALNKIALKMDNDESGRARMYDAFRKLHARAKAKEVLCSHGLWTCAECAWSGGRPLESRRP